MWTSLLISAVAVLTVAEGVCYTFQKDYYEEIGCKPEGELDQSGCAVSYDCSSLTERSKGKCYYQGVAYDEHYKLEATPESSCLADCTCGELFGTELLTFTCAHIECGELFRPPPAPGCYNKYEYGKCCSVEKVCETEESKTSKDVCVYNGTTYQVGQQFFPSEKPCHRCICQAGYTGSLEEPFCRKFGCSAELARGREISEGCVPVYFSTTGCCPMDWRCPDVADQVVAADPSLQTTPVSDKTCKFGSLMLKIGDKLNRRAGNECVCNIPPLVTCIHQRPSQA